MSTYTLTGLMFSVGLVIGTILVAAEPEKEEQTVAKNLVTLEGAFGKAEFNVQAPAMTGLHLRGPDGRLSAQSLLSKQGVTSYRVPCLGNKPCAAMPWARGGYTYVVGQDGTRYESRNSPPDSMEATQDAGRPVVRVRGVKLRAADSRTSVATEDWILSAPGDGKELVWQIVRRWTTNFTATVSGSPGLFFGFHPRHLSDAVTSTLWYDPQRLAARSNDLYRVVPSFNQLVTVQDRDSWAIYKLWSSWHAPADLRLQVEGGHLFRRGNLALLSEAGAVTGLEAAQQLRAGQVEQATLRLAAVDKRTTGYQLAVTVPDKAAEESLREFYGSLFNGGTINNQKQFNFGNETDGFAFAGTAWAFGTALSVGLPTPGQISSRPYGISDAFRDHLSQLLKSVDDAGWVNFGLYGGGKSRIWDIRLQVIVGVRMYWLHTGDLVSKDKKGNLFFAGRKTEFMRRKGENISAYDVEQAILQHPDIVEAAVFAVPSELAEDEVMAVVVGLEGKKLDPLEIVKFLEDKLAKFAIPRFWRIMAELPKTETQRVIKGVLEKQGRTPDTIDTDQRASGKKG